MFRKHIVKAPGKKPEIRLSLISQVQA